MKNKYLLILLPLSIYGCALSADEKHSPEQPALLKTSSSESILELQTVAATLLAKKHILLAENAFTKHSELTIERLPHKSKDGQLIMGRSIELPYALQLIMKDGKCFLKEKSSGKMLALATSHCVIE
jgi:hypothetical protein